MAIQTKPTPWVKGDTVTHLDGNRWEHNAVDLNARLVSLLSDTTKYQKNKITQDDATPLILLNTVKSTLKILQDAPIGFSTITGTSNLISDTFNKSTVEFVGVIHKKNEVFANIKVTDVNDITYSNSFNSTGGVVGWDTQNNVTYTQKVYEYLPPNLYAPTGSAITLNFPGIDLTKVDYVVFNLSGGALRGDNHSVLFTCTFAGYNQVAPLTLTTQAYGRVVMNVSSTNTSQMSINVLNVPYANYYITKIAVFKTKERGV